MMKKCEWHKVPALLLITIFFVSSGNCDTQDAAQTARTDETIGWQLEGGWTINQTPGGDELIGQGQGQATYEESCEKGPLAFSFKLKSLTGLLNANININGSNRYIISFLNNGNGTLSSYLVRDVGLRRIEGIKGQSILYDPYREHQVDIYSKEGQIQVYIYKNDTVRSIASRTGYMPVIIYSDPDPLPPGKIAFQTNGDLEGTSASFADVYDIEVNCPRRSQNRGPPDLGIGYFKRPAEESLISSIWGQVPANQVLVVVDNNLSFEDARSVARNLSGALDGEIVGEFEFINLFQIETESRDLPELKRDLSRSKDYALIRLAFPNEQVFLEAEDDPLQDEVYSDGRSGGYELIKVQEVWNLIKVMGKELFGVHVGVTDNGLYRGYSEFDGDVQINTTSPSSNLTSPGTDFPDVGSHGTGVTNILAADPDNGGIAGIASEPLRKKLKVTMVNIFPDGRSFSTDSLLGLKEEIESGCSILSCSWGDSNAHEDTAEAYWRFFEKISIKYPCLLFVCSAGNEGRKLDGGKRIPSGKRLPNMITVGNTLNDGILAPSSNIDNDSFEVTMGAPGENAVWGWNPKTKKIKANEGGTSMATPHVTAAATIIRSLDPYLYAEEIKDVLRENAHSGPDGEPILDMAAAVQGVIDDPTRCSRCENCTSRSDYEVEVPEEDGAVGRETPQPAEGPLKIVSFTFTPNPVCAGDATKMSWTTTGATGVTITPGIGIVEPSGSRILTPKQSMGYTIRAWNVSANTKPMTVLLRLEQCIVPGVTSMGGAANVVFDFIEEAHGQGQWQGGPEATIFRFGDRSEGDKRGSAVWKNNLLLSDMSIAGKALLVRPPENGYITGTYRYMNYIVHETDHLSGEIGFASGAYAGNATFSVHLIEGNIDRLLFQRSLAYYDGALSFDIPLKDYVGWQPAVSLRIDSNGPSLQDACVWKDVKITGSSIRPVARFRGEVNAGEGTVSSNLVDWNPSGRFDRPTGSNVDWLRA